MSANANVSPGGSVVRRGCAVLVVGLLLIGFLARAVPQFLGPDRYLQHHATEDGYLMLTIARNLALGLGMSTADGTLPTNGTQPATTFVWALGFLATGADKAHGVWVALMLQLLASVASTWLLFRVTRLVLADHVHGRTIAWLTAAAWSGSLRTSMHVMNCLETGFYALALLGFAFLLVRHGDPLRSWTLRRAAGLGAMLGLVFWVRIDAVFLIGAVCLVRWLFAEGFRFAPSRQQLGAAVVTGAVAVAIASPWLIHNKIHFGRFTPVSGISQSHHAGLGDNLGHMLAALAEYTSVVIAFPQSVLGKGWFVAACGVVAVAALLLCIVVFRRGSSMVRACLAIFGVFGLCLAGYYGLLFGAAHFVSRYLFPVSMLMAAVVAGAAVTAWARLGAAARVATTLTTAVAVLALVGSLQWRTFQKNARHQHWQVVEFVRTIPEETWVAAVQTGTLGYFHDRTINLDGKVNPEALAALLRGEEAFHQFVADCKAEYLIDWVGFARFVTDHARQYAGKMEVLVEDHDKNLAVLRRIGR